MRRGLVVSLHHTGMEAAFWFYDCDIYSVPARVRCTRQRLTRETLAVFKLMNL